MLRRPGNEDTMQGTGVGRCGWTFAAIAIALVAATLPFTATAQSPCPIGKHHFGKDPIAFEFGLKPLAPFRTGTVTIRRDGTVTASGGLKALPHVSRDDVAALLRVAELEGLFFLSSSGPISSPSCQFADGPVPFVRVHTSVGVKEVDKAPYCEKGSGPRRFNVVFDFLGGLTGNSDLTNQ